MKICAFTGTRADYGLLKPLLKLIKNDDSLELQILATGMHLSHDYGYTLNEIENDGFKVNEKIPILSSSDSSLGISKAMGKGMALFSEAIDRLKPDIIIILGDRFEAFAMASAAMIANIPIAHLNGGEATYGLIDEPIRHSITKMSHLHFTATEEFQKRVIQLGEKSAYVFNVGSIGLDNIKALEPLSKKELEKSLDYKFQDQNIVITFHPLTLDIGSAKQQFTSLLSALDSFPNVGLIFTKSNADTDGKIINELIDQYVLKRENAKAYFSLGSHRYLSVLNEIDCVLGNSSSGLIEAPSFKVPTVNIGDRQKGRILAKTIISSDTSQEDIYKSISTALDQQFVDTLQNVENPYGDGNTAIKILKELKKVNLKGILKKEFCNL